MLENAWHIPDNGEPRRQASMRSPIIAAAGEAVSVFSGNQFKGGVGAANQFQTGSAVFFKKAASANWSSVPLKFRSTNGNNKYFAGEIPPDSFQVGDIVQYYLRIVYDPNERQTTFLFGSDGNSLKTASEAEARSNPYLFVVRTPPEPAGSFDSFDMGQLQARIYRDSCEIQLAGPNLADDAHATVLSFAAGARVADMPLVIGRVVESMTTANGLELVQEFGRSSVQSRLSFPHEGVMRYEVLNWNGMDAGIGFALVRFDHLGDSTQVIVLSS